MTDKVEVRVYADGAEGEEIAGKGVSFKTDEGPSNLIEALLKHGYGDTRKTLNGLSDREDFPIAIKEIIEEKFIKKEVNCSKCGFKGITCK